MFLLDTNVVSELRTGKRMPSAAVRRWASSISEHQMYLSSVNLVELEVGVLSMERKDVEQGRIMRAWLRLLEDDYIGRILPFTETTALFCAPMHVPNRRSYRDAMIAATAKEHGYIVVTRNVRDFQDCGVAVLNPWEDLKPN